MADTTVDQGGGEMLPLGAASRRLGAEAAAEQRELLALLLDDANDFSGFARRGILMRLLDLADLAEELFDGCSADDPYILASRLHGTGNARCCNASDGIRAERDVVHQ